MSDEDQLSRAEREFEAALRSLRPTPARIDPMSAAIGRRPRAVRSRLQLWQLAAAAAAIVIVGGTWLALRPSGQVPDIAAHKAPMNERQVPATESPVELPTLLVYRQALARSPAELESLLDRQARGGSAPNNETMRVGMLTFWNTNSHLQKGDM